MKKSFTLIEVMISIAIFSLLVLFMSKVVSNLNISVNILKNDYSTKTKQQYLIKTLYADILNKKWIKIVNHNKNYSIVYLQTSNSLYNIPMPYVVWYVSKKQNSLMRLECSQKCELPTNIGWLDKFDKGVKIFKIYQKQNKFFIFIKDKKELFFEM